jgi:hypothetical protein
MGSTRASVLKILRNGDVAVGLLRTISLAALLRRII